MKAYLIWEDFGKDQEATHVALTEEKAYSYIRKEVVRLYELSRKSPTYGAYPLEFFTRYFRVTEVTLLD